MTTIKQLLENGSNDLAQADILTPLLDAKVLLTHLLQCDKLCLHTHSNEIVSASIIDKYRSMIDKRATCMPVAYIIQNKEFMSLDFYVDQRVLIPRPETELLVEKAIETAKSFTKKNSPCFRSLLRQWVHRHLHRILHQQCRSAAVGSVGKRIASCTNEHNKTCIKTKSENLYFESF